MPIKPFIHWSMGLYLDPKKELWPFVHEVILTYEERSFVVANMSNYNFDVCLFISHSFMACSFWDFDGRTTPFSTVICLKTKAGVILTDMNDIKGYLLL